MNGINMIAIVHSNRELTSVLDSMPVDCIMYASFWKSRPTLTRAPARPCELLLIVCVKSVDVLAWECSDFGKGECFLIDVHQFLL